MTHVITLILIIVLILFVIILFMFASIQHILLRQEKTIMLVIEAIGKLTQAQKSCLSYLQKIQKELDTYDGK